MAAPRVVDGIEGAVVGMAGSDKYSLAITGEGRVLVFGRADEGALGLGAGVIRVTQTLTPTVIDGITMGAEEEGKAGQAEGKEE